MNKINNKSGFTLIEIIVVLIIVGILASIALPNLFSNVTKSRSAEALTNLSALKTQVEGCQQARNATCATDCIFAGPGGITDPSTGNFTITISTPPTNGSANAAQTYTMLAKSKFDGGADTITMVRNGGGTITCTGAGGFLGSC